MVILTTTSLLADARLLYRQGLPEEAIRLLVQGVEYYSSDYGLWELLGIIYLLESHSMAAQHALETAASLRQLSVGARMALAECYRQRRHELLGE